MISQEYVSDISNWKIKFNWQLERFYIGLKNKDQEEYSAYLLTNGKIENRATTSIDIPAFFKDKYHKNNYYYKTESEAELALQSFLEKIQPKVFKKEDLELLK